METIASREATVLFAATPAAAAVHAHSCTAAIPIIGYIIARHSRRLDEYQHLINNNTAIK